MVDRHFSFDSSDGHLLDGIDLTILILNNKNPSLKISVVLTPEESLASLATLKDVLVDACQLALSNAYVVPSEQHQVVRLEEGRYTNPVTTHRIHKDVLPLWYKLQMENSAESSGGVQGGVVPVVSSYDTLNRHLTITCFAENSLEMFLGSFKTTANLMLVLGASASDLSLHDNWCNDEDDCSVYDTYRLVEQRCATRTRSFVHDLPYSDDGELEVAAVSPPAPVARASTRAQPGETLAPHTTGRSVESLGSSCAQQDLEGDVWSDGPAMRNSPLPDTPQRLLSPSVVRPTVPPLSLLMAKGCDMPAPTLRVTLHQTRTATDMYGKSYTIYNLVVKQGGLEWMVDHRYSGGSVVGDVWCRSGIYTCCYGCIVDAVALIRLSCS